MLATNETLEREVNTKRTILAEFEDKKKLEIAKYKKTIESQKLRINKVELAFEDVSSDIWRLNDKYQLMLDENNDLQAKIALL